MSVKMRQRVERIIARRLVMDAIRAGYALNVNNGGEDDELKEPSTSVREVMAAMMGADDDRVHVYVKSDSSVWIHFGWVWFVYGNDGYDVISDYTVNLEPIMTGADALADKYGG